MLDPRAAILGALMAVVGACTAADALLPSAARYDHEDGEIVQGPLRVTLTVSPDALDPPGTAMAVLTYENLGNRTLVLGSSAGCLSFASVYLGENRIPFPSTQYGCTAAFTTRELAPGAPLSVQWPLVIGGEEGMQVPAGTYRFVAQLNTHPEPLERTFVVR